MTHRFFRQRSRIWSLLVFSSVLVFILAACGSSAAEDASQTTAGQAADQEIADLQAKVTSLEQDAKYWQQLTSLMQPVEMPSMSDHRAFMLPSGVVLALHFDNMDLSKAANLNWVALGIPGRFCTEDQERVEAQYGPGFTHFHDMKNDTHGGAAGAEGVWFIHTAVRDFEAPWGPVQQGVDAKFMPTEAPACA